MNQDIENANMHSAPQAERSEPRSKRCSLIFITGKAQDACEALAHQLDEWLEQTPESINETRREYQRNPRHVVAW